MLTLILLFITQPKSGQNPGRRDYMCGRCQENTLNYRDFDDRPLSPEAIARGMAALKKMTTPVCGNESAARKEEEFLKKVRALSGEHPVVYGRDCKGALTFADSLHSKPPNSSSE